MSEHKAAPEMEVDIKICISQGDVKALFDRLMEAKQTEHKLKWFNAVEIVGVPKGVNASMHLACGGLLHLRESLELDSKRYPLIDTDLVQGLRKYLANGQRIPLEGEHIIVDRMPYSDVDHLFQFSIFGKIKF